MVKQKTKADSVENQLRALHQLQVIDSKIDNIRIVRGELPLEISDLKDTIAGLNLRLDKIQSEIDDINDNIVGNKNTISLAVAAVEKYEEQLKNIKNNREYTSLTKEVEYQNLEIELANKKKNQNDASILHKTEILNSCKDEINEKEEELKIKTDQLNEIIAETEKEEKSLLQESKKAEKVINERLLAQYKRIRSKVPNGLAVVSVERSSCSGYQIPPQMLLDIKMHKKVTSCEHCGRILVDAEQFEN
ncbi:MAG: C4-type zinc ribbon domain-containing protein [Bacteroidota bacterium]|nr:C4-type zinc ribbon domain-containing protein [Bacteroidota bacterium]